jgi:hypothetical protein
MSVPSRPVAAAAVASGGQNLHCLPASIADEAYLYSLFAVSSHLPTNLS